MRPITRTQLAASAASAALAAALAIPFVAAGVAGATERSPEHAVFVQTGNVDGNQVVAYDRNEDGTLSLARGYDTGGKGGALNGAVVDRYASQGALGYDAAHQLLFATNAGSNTVSVFAVQGDRLSLRQVVGSGGTFPVSVTVHDGIVYVLNALGDANVSGFREAGGKLHPIHGSTRSLDLTIPTDKTQFVNTPGQVAFTPDGDQLVVTTKANGRHIDVFGVRHNGRLSATPTVNTQPPGNVPFGITFDRAGKLLVAQAGSNTVASFDLHADGTVSSIETAAIGQAATCWIAPAGDFFYASNAGGPTVTGLTSVAGDLTTLTNTTTNPGTVDAAGTRDGRNLYVQTGLTGTVDEFTVNHDGSLTAIGSVLVPGAAGGEGIIAA